MSPDPNTIDRRRNEYTMVLTRVGDGPKRPQILLGTFCHSVSRTELDILHDAAVAVDEAGKIVAVVKGAGSIAAAKAQALKETGWAEGDVSVSEAKRGQFFFPGFIGRCNRGNVDMNDILTAVEQTRTSTPRSTPTSASLARRRSSTGSTSTRSLPRRASRTRRARDEYTRRA